MADKLQRTVRSLQHRCQLLKLDKPLPKVGDKYNRLTIIKMYNANKYGQNHTFVDCLCDCGNINENIRLSVIIDGKTKSCGCLRNEKATKRLIEYNQKIISHIKDEDIREIIRLYRLGWSKQKLAIKYNTSDATIGRFLKDNNIDIRGRSQSKTFGRKLREDFFENIDTEEKAYWLGFLDADGGIWENQIRLRLARKDKQHLIKFQQSLNIENPVIDFIEHGKYESSMVTIRSNKLTQDLAKLGCIQNKTKKLEPPKLDDSMIKHFIRGYFDGDGCIGKYKNQWLFHLLGTYNMMDFISHFLSKYTNRKLNIRPRTSIFEISTSGNNIVPKIMTAFYYNPNLYLYRKFKLVQQCLNHKAR